MSITEREAIEMESTALVQRDAPITAMSLLQLAVDRGANIDTIERLAKLQREMQDFQAKIDYGIAMKSAQEAIPRIAPDLTNPQTHSKYASYAALDRVIRPVYTRQGFSLSFNTGESSLPDQIRVFCKVRHIGGHEEPFQIDMPNDGKGAKGGDVMTKTHAQAAGASYGMRYLLKMIFNIAIGEEDRDGNGQEKGDKIKDEIVVERLEWIKSSKDLVELQRVFTNAYKMAEQAGDADFKARLIKAKDVRKGEIRQCAQ